MLEALSDPNNAMISQPDALVVATIRELVSSRSAPIVAEIGVGIGATSLAMAEVLDNRGELHLFDFQGRASELVGDLKVRGFTNVFAHENTKRYWDSYNHCAKDMA